MCTVCATYTNTEIHRDNCVGATSLCNQAVPSWVNDHCFALATNSEFLV